MAVNTPFAFGAATDSGERSKAIGALTGRRSDKSIETI